MHLLQKCVKSGLLQPAAEEGEGLSLHMAQTDDVAYAAALPRLLSIARSGRYDYPWVHHFFVTYLRMVHIEDAGLSLHEWQAYWEKWQSGKRPLPVWGQALCAPTQCASEDAVMGLSGRKVGAGLSDVALRSLAGYFISQPYARLFSCLLSASYWTQDMAQLQRAAALSVMIHSFLQVLYLAMHERGMRDGCYPFFLLPVEHAQLPDDPMQAVAVQLVTRFGD